MKGQAVTIVGLSLLVLIANILSGAIAVSKQTPYNTTYWCYGGDKTYSFDNRLDATNKVGLIGKDQYICSGYEWVFINATMVKNQISYFSGRTITDNDGRDWDCGVGNLSRDTVCIFGGRTSTYGKILLGI